MVKSIIKRLLFKSLVFAAIVVGWFYYYNSTVIGQTPVSNIKLPDISTDDISVSGIKKAVGNLGDKIQDSASIEPQKTRVYKWYDANGKLHVSNTPPTGVANVEVREYRSDTNILPSGKTGTAGQQQPSNKSNKASSGNDSSSDGSRTDGYKDLLKKAQQSRQTMEQRNRALDDIVNQ